MRNLREISPAINNTQLKKKLDRARKSGEMLTFEEPTPIGPIIETVYYDPESKLFITHDIILKEHGINFRSLRKNSAKFIRMKYNCKEFGDKEDEGSFYVITSDLHTKSPFICYSGFNHVGYRLSILHELYHSAHPKKLLKIEEGLKEARKEFGMRMKKVLVGKKVDEDKFTSSFEYYSSYHRKVAQEERNATAWALKMIRAYRRKGIDLEPNLPRHADLSDYIHDPEGFTLGTYELAFQKELQSHRINPGVIESLKGTYSRKASRIIEMKRILHG